jgi:mono/diheme cytochrome c family protein
MHRTSVPAAVRDHAAHMHNLLFAAVVAAAQLRNPILFVTQVPVAADFTAVASVFGNQNAAVAEAPRGGDLWIRYPDGTLKNLTHAAGFGGSGMQGATSIAVREPSVHWSGTKALFSMVIGAPPQRYLWETYVWQMYEITGLGEHDTPVIHKIANQPASYNNVSPFYGTDDRILFTSDRPRGGEAHLYPQLDEYEEAPTVTGLWSLDPASGDLRMLNHTPSGLFSPSIDSYGRVIFTRWDHLQRDQQADSDATDAGSYGTFDYADESAHAARLNQRVEVFPEPRSSRTDLLNGTNLQGISINQFFPWEINEDGTSEETLNHVGRHELFTYFDRSMNDAGLVEFYDGNVNRANANLVENLLQLREDPAHAGVYFGVDAPEFYTHAAGQIVRFSAPPSLSADQIAVTYITPRSTRDFADGTPAADASGHYREPLPLEDGTLLAVHTSELRADSNDGTRSAPKSRYAFRIRTLVPQNGTYVPGDALTTGIQGSVSYWDPDELVTWSGEMWELSPVEVRARPRPVRRTTPLDEPEARLFREEGVDPAAFRASLAAQDLAVIVSRNVTARDSADKQQPYNLRVAGSATQKITGSSKVFDVAHLQLFQGDQLRGLGGTTSPRAGRRVLARPMHDASVKNAPTSGPVGSVQVAPDGSVAAFVPAHRAMSWQLTDGAGTAVVRERYWLSFQPGEVRVCGACHGVNTHDQLGEAAPQNAPEALRKLLRAWKSTQAPAPPRRRAVRK